MIGNILALTLIANNPTRAAPPDVARVDITTAEPCAHVVAFDSAGDFAGSILLCADEAGRVILDADFADDLYLAMRYDDDGYPTIESNDAPAAAERIGLVLGKIDPGVQGDDGWVPCAAGVVGTVASIVAVQFWLTGINSYVMACECLPLLVEEFEDIECPGF